MPVSCVLLAIYRDMVIGHVDVMDLWHRDHYILGKMEQEKKNGSVSEKISSFNTKIVILR